MRRKRIAVGSVFTESNHFSAGFTEYEAFEDTELLRGGDVLGGAQGAVRGMLDVCQAAKCEILPLVVASAYPGPPLSLACYLRLRGDVLAALREAGAVDGVLLALHGAAAVAEIGDLEGDLIGAVRQEVGPDVPILVSLDMHGHVTKEMMSGADAIVAWETYPHRDALETGMRAARLLLDTLEGRLRPTMALAKVPLLASGIHGSTEGSGPMARLMRAAKALEGQSRIVSTSLFQVHPYLDFPDLGATALVVTDDDPDLAERVAIDLARQFWNERDRFAVETFSPEQAVSLGLTIAGGPVVLVETADCVGGGAAGDSVATLRALLPARFDGTALVPVVDPQAAAECHHAGESSLVSLQLGHQIDRRWGKPLELQAEVVRLTDGHFRYSGGIWQGKDATMGPSALVKAAGVCILITTRPTYDWADEQFQSVGFRACDTKFVVAKNPMNYRLAYQQVAKQFLILDTPGPTPAKLDHLPYRRLRPPVYPIHGDLPRADPIVIAGKHHATQAGYGGPV